MNTGSWMDRWLGALLGLENVQSIDHYQFSFGEAWAHRAPAWVLFGCVALGFAAFWFYLRYQTRVRSNARYGLALARALVLALLFIMLANPIVRMVYVSSPRPLLYFLVDGTDSMAIEDDLSEEQRSAIALAVDWRPEEAAPASASKPLSALQSNFATAVESASSEQDKQPSRMEYVRSLLASETHSPLKKLAEKFRLKVFLLDKPDGVRAIPTSPLGDGDSI